MIGRITVFGLLILIPIYILTTIRVIHIDEGNLGVTHRFGKIQPDVLHPGLHVHLSFMSQIHTVPITFQTMVLDNVDCGTRSGVTLYFKRIEIVYQLRGSHVIPLLKNYSFEYLRSHFVDFLPRAHINELCSKMELHSIFIEEFDQVDEMLMESLKDEFKQYAPGLEIVSIRLTKPEIPQKIKSNYEEIQNQKSKLLMLDRKEETELQKETAAKRKSVMEVEKKAAVQELNLAKKISKVEDEHRINQIDAQMHTEAANQKADSTYYTIMKEAESNERKLTSKYLDYIRVTKEFENTKMYFGDSIPEYIFNDEKVAKKTIHKHK
eukprot:TRINITY_DN1064_c0_g1_i1.p1 TRINITY_DN1064_c0_g1~~TRINITY_DN1064_c0_g1_i1.p1  ORF type:complete len:323 (+),score=57.98 TRINITY_DN1064_c0_g1_i1:30-998(+)